MRQSDPWKYQKRKKYWAYILIIMRDLANYDRLIILLSELYDNHSFLKELTMMLNYFLRMMTFFIPV